MSTSFSSMRFSLSFALAFFAAWLPHPLTRASRDASSAQAMCWARALWGRGRVPGIDAVSLEVEVALGIEFLVRRAPLRHERLKALLGGRTEGDDVGLLARDHLDGAEGCSRELSMACEDYSDAHARYVPKLTL